MYYEEQWIEGALCWRTSPDGAWTRYTANELAHRYESAEKRASDAQATVEALQAVIRQMGEQAAVLTKDGMAAKAQVEALQRERDKLREATKVICGHCCEPMAIPSKAILKSQLSALQGLVETIKCELFDRYDGAPDSPTRWMGPLIRDIEIAQALPATPDSYQQGRVAGLREAGPILAKVCEWYEGGTLEQILEEFYAQLKLAQQAQGEKGRA